MGTRHLIAVQLDGGYKVAQYGQWDGYPSGQGARVLEFLRDVDINAFTSAVRACTFIGDDEVQRRWKEVGADDSGFVSMDIADKFKARWPQLSRDTGSKVLEFVLNTGGAELVDSSNFAANSLFCEWAYVIDLDRGCFEVYEGFNKDKLDPCERFHGFEQSHPRNEYQPVKLVKIYPLDALPTVEQFLADLEPAESSEEG